jgi:hypothetical protein
MDLDLINERHIYNRMKEIQIGTKEKNLTFKSSEVEKIIHITANDSNKSLKFDYDTEDLKVVLRFLTEEQDGTETE